MRTFVGVLLGAAMVVAASPAAAQVNVESLRGDLLVTPAKATLEGSFTGRTGNVESVVAGASAIGAARLGRHQLLASSLADYTRFGQETKVSRSFIHLRWNYQLTDWFLPEVFAQQQQDKFQRLLVRELVGTGPRFVVANEQDVKVAVGTAYMLEYERIRVAPGATDRDEIVSHRWSNYVSWTWRADTRVRATSTIYVQPRFDDFGDVRVLFEAALITEVAKRLSVKIIATMRHDSEPPTGVKRTDLEIKNAIVLHF